MFERLTRRNTVAAARLPLQDSPASAVDARGDKGRLSARQLVLEFALMVCSTDGNLGNLPGAEFSIHGDDVGVLWWRTIPTPPCGLRLAGDGK